MNRVVLNDNLKGIGNYAFNYSIEEDRLKDLVIPASVKIIYKKSIITTSTGGSLLHMVEFEDKDNCTIINGLKHFVLPYGDED